MVYKCTNTNRTLALFARKGETSRMFTLDEYSRVPIYQQIIDGLRKEISLDSLPPGGQAYSVRELSNGLRANPNTVQKAYNELIREGLILSVPGKGNFISEDARGILRERIREEEKQSVAGSVRKLFHSGVAEDEVHSWIREIYQSEGGKSS